MQSYTLHCQSTLALAYKLVNEYDAWQRQQDKEFKHAQKKKEKAVEPPDGA
jgi:hypothetical protein